MVTSATEFLRRHDILGYFLLAFAISWLGALIVAAPPLMHGHPIPRMSGILMFPAMLVGPLASGITMTLIVDGTQGLKGLFARMRRARTEPRWYAVLLIPPGLVLGTLLCLRTFISPAFAPNHFYFGFLFGIPAGIFEEIGWTGYAFPKMVSKYGALKAAIMLGSLWVLWHLPVIDYLGAAGPHGIHWLHFFLAFALAMTALRVLIAWLYINTESVLLTQFMHISSTGALVIFSPPATPAQEATWYAAYGGVAWLVAGLIVVTHGHTLLQQDSSWRP